MAKTKIEWATDSWNPTTGCTKISPGCAHCYAERMAKRLQAMGNKKYRNGFRLTLHPESLEEPLHWKKPRNIFVCSMSDLFHKDVPDSFINDVFNIMHRAYWHTFLVLTKRAERLRLMSDGLEFTENIWVGVTTENQDMANERVPYLLGTHAKVHFVSAEPLLGPIDFYRPPPLDWNMLTGENYEWLDSTPAPMPDMPRIDWVIVGGESGPGARPMKPEWVRSIRDQCIEAGVPFFFKQWGGVNKKKTGRVLDGRMWDELPNGGNA